MLARGAPKAAYSIQNAKRKPDISALFSPDFGRGLCVYGGCDQRRRETLQNRHYGIYNRAHFLLDNDDFSVRNAGNYASCGGSIAIYSAISVTLAVAEHFNRIW